MMLSQISKLDVVVVDDDTQQAITHLCRLLIKEKAILAKATVNIAELEMTLRMMFKDGDE